MELIKKNILTIQFEDIEVETITDIVNKLSIECKKAGYKKLFNRDEIELIDDVVSKIKEYEVKK